MLFPNEHYQREAWSSCQLQVCLVNQKDSCVEDHRSKMLNPAHDWLSLNPALDWLNPTARDLLSPTFVARSSFLATWTFV